VIFKKSANPQRHCKFTEKKEECYYVGPQVIDCNLGMNASCRHCEFISEAVVCCHPELVSGSVVYYRC
jgi:hypothetical protein